MQWFFQIFFDCGFVCKRIKSDLAQLGVVGVYGAATTVDIRLDSAERKQKCEGKRNNKINTQHCSCTRTRLTLSTLA